VNAGVSGFILKDATLEDFLRTIRSVHKGLKVLPPTMTASLFAQVVDYAVKKGKIDLVVKAVQLTTREQEIIKLISEGGSNKDISRELNIAVHTVKSHVHNTLEKLALQTRLQLANYVHSRELIPFSIHRPIDKTQIRPLIRVKIEIIRGYGALPAPDRINLKDGFDNV
jgi:DNA-binding NarL/FixJ family response regulator